MTLVRFIAGASAFGLGVYSTMVYLSIKKQPDPPNDIDQPWVQQQYQFSGYSNLALRYDQDIDRSEWLMGITKLRERLIRLAKGKVLEVAAGTARNLDLYQHVDELVFVDLSTDMLEQAQHKFKGQKARLIKANAEALPFQDQTFDVVIDTFGLCSCQDPVAMLKEMKRVGKRVLLLEHGQSHYPWLNQFMNRTAIQHYHHWGCWWNRDIVSLIQQSGLRILHSERKHFGTTFFIVAE